MAESSDEVLFKVMTPLGFEVRVNRVSWELIVTVKHPVMAGHEEDVKQTLLNPTEIRLSKSDHTVYLFYGPQRVGRWVCGMAKRQNGDGSLITHIQPMQSKKELVYGPRKSLI